METTSAIPPKKPVKCIKAFSPVAIVLIAGSMLIWWTAHVADQQMRKKLAVQNDLILKGFAFKDFAFITSENYSKPDDAFQGHVKSILKVDRNFKCFYLIGRNGFSRGSFCFSCEPGEKTSLSVKMPNFTESPENFWVIFSNIEFLS
ncbi:MAG: hypothetical protein ACOYXC_04420, partial [Candidatus Rifleibacteriota bacterium]